MIDKLDIEALKKGAAKFQQIASEVEDKSQTVSVDAFRLKLQRQFSDAAEKLETVYIHPGRLTGADMLRGKLPAVILDSALEKGMAIFRTVTPKADWFVVVGGVQLVDNVDVPKVCVSIEKDESTFSIYHLSVLKASEDIWHLIF